MLDIAFVAILGLIVGSYLNVVILRLHTGRSTAGRSGCMSCRAQLSWHELVPVLSYFFLKGRCSNCGSSISAQYWMVEALTAVLFVLVWVQHLTLIHTLVAWILMSLLVIIAVYDLRHTIIPNIAVYAFIGVGFIANTPRIGTFVPQELLIHFAIVCVSGALVALPLFLLWLVSRGMWMGFGDVKLVFGFGLILGVYKGLMAVMLGFVTGAVVGVVLMAVPKVMKLLPLRQVQSRFTMKSEIPFAPFLIAGFLLVFLFNVDLIALMGVLI